MLIANKLPKWMFFLNLMYLSVVEYAFPERHSSSKVHQITLHFCRVGGEKVMKNDETQL